MPSIPYGTGAYRRTAGSLPVMRLVNMFVESAKTSENGVALQSRKGLVNGTLYPAVIEGIYADPGVRNDELWVVSNNNLYSDGTLRGAMEVISGPVSWAGYQAETVLTRGNVVYSFNEAGTFAAVAMPDAQGVTACCFIGSLFVYAIATSQRFYWSAPLDGRTVNPLDFASAEREGDHLLDVKALGDNLILFGQSTIEAWSHTGDADLPFTRIDQLSFDKGVKARGCVAEIDNGLMWVGADNIAYRWGEVPQRISDHWLEAAIAASSSVSVFSFQYEGHPFFAIRLDTATYAYDVATQEWCEFATYGQTNWIAGCGGQWQGQPVFGSAVDGYVLTFSGWADRSIALERIFTAAAPLDNPLSVNRLQVWTGNQGGEIDMRSSDDAGDSWSAWEAENMDDPRAIPEWRALGMFDAPGMMFEFRNDQAADFRISAVKVNEKGGGRSRVA